MTALFVTAFVAGMVSTVNPCGFAMLPAYLGFFLGAVPEDRVRAWSVAVPVASGFLAVFTIAGILVTLGLRAVIDAIPWLALAVGAGLVVVGGALLSGIRLLPAVRGPSRVRRDPTWSGMFVFGVSYAVASLSCTLPIFLSLVAGIVSAETAVTGVAAFVVYGAGMATAVTGVTLLVAGGRRTILDRLRGLARHLDRIAAVVMIAAGVFIVWYWAAVLAGGGAGSGSSGLVRWVDEVSAAATGFVADNAFWVALVIIVAVGALATRRLSEDR